MQKAIARTGKRHRRAIACSLSVLILLLAFGAIYCLPGNNPLSNFFALGTNKSLGIGPFKPHALAPEDQVYGLPKSPAPATNFYVTSTGGQGDPMSYTISALAGLVARNQPQLFHIASSGDQTWLNYIESSYGMRATTISNTQALTQFESYVQSSGGKIRVIEYDWNDSFYPMQVNMAATLAGVYSALPVSNTEMSTIDSIFGSSNVDVMYNLVGMFTGSNASTVMVNAYNWLWNLAGNQTTKAFFSMNPEGRANLDDYIVEFKAFQFEFCCYNLSSSNNQAPPLTSAEMNFVTKVLSTYPPNTADVGYIGFGEESYTISILSQFGMSEIAVPELSDLSFYSGFPTLTNLSQAPSAQSQITYNPSKVYVLFEFTQGDALTFDAYTNWGLYNAVDSVTGQPYRNEISVAWQINPIMAEIAPPIMKAYYSEQQGSLDDFITGPSGGSGYDHPDGMGTYEPAQNAMSHAVSSNAGIGTYFVIFGGNPFSDSIDQTYVQQAQPNAVLLWQNSGHAPAIVDGVPFMTSTFWVNVGTTFTPSDVTSTVSTIVGDAGNTHFVYAVMNAQNPGMPFIAQVMNALGSGYQAVNAGQFVSLYCDSQHDACNTQVNQSSTTSTPTTSSTASKTSTSSVQASTTTLSHTLTTTLSHTSTTTLTRTSTVTSAHTTTKTTTESRTLTSTYTYTSTLTSVSSISGTTSNSTITLTQTGTTTYVSNFTTTIISIETPNATTTSSSNTTSSYTSTLAPATTRDTSNSSSVLIGGQANFEAQRTRNIATTMALGTSAFIVLVGIFPLAYLFRKMPAKKRSR